MTKKAGTTPNSFGRAALSVVDSVARMDGASFRDVPVGIDAASSEIVLRNAHFENVTRPLVLNRSSGDVRGSKSTFTNAPDIAAVARRSHVGWRRSPGPAIPVYCDACGALFRSEMFTVFDAAVYSKDNTEQCLCGNQEAKLATGLYEFGQETIKLISGGVVTKDQLKQLEADAKAALKGALSVESLLDELRSISPALASATVNGWRRGKIFILLTIGLLALGGRFASEGAWLWDAIFGLSEPPAASADTPRIGETLAAAPESTTVAGASNNATQARGSDGQAELGSEPTSESQSIEHRRPTGPDS